MGVIDYHDFVNIDTPAEERRKLNVGDIFINAATCKLCGDTVRSRNRHDFVTCSCGNLSVDGGSAYIRIMIKKENSYKLNVVYFSDVKKNRKRKNINTKVF